MNPQTESQEITEALNFIPADERDVWVRVGMAIHHHLGAAGYEIWRDWSAGADNYRESSCRSVWASFRGDAGGRPVTIGSLFREAKQYGYQRSKQREARTIFDIERDRQREARQLFEQQQRLDAQKRAAIKALGMLSEAQVKPHVYLEGKGFENAVGFVDKRGGLLIPMRDARSDLLLGVQRINTEGEKKFQPHGLRVSGAVFRLGPRYGIQRRWLVEGYATGLSLRAALDALYREHDQIIVCFSAANIRTVAAGLPYSHRRVAAVMADNDRWRCTKSHTWDWKGPAEHEAHTAAVKAGRPTPCPFEGCPGKVIQPAGQRFASATGLPWFCPGDSGDDWNDLHQRDEQEFISQVCLAVENIFLDERKGWLG